MLLITDGLDRDDPGRLAVEADRLHRSCKRLIWLNPLIGMDDYQPLTRGITTAMPFIDVFVSAHNLDSLLQLERYLSDV